MDKKKAYEEFLKKMEDCAGCTMRGYGEPVFNGNYNQEIMIIGFEPESHNVEINSSMIAKASKLLTLYQEEVKYGAYITYVHRCSLYVHGEISEEGKENCIRLLREEIEIVRPKYMIIFDERVIDAICDNADLVKNAEEYPVETTVFSNKVKLYYLK
ncbi:MAG: hypothetical protein R6U31_08375 [bacterium]